MRSFRFTGEGVADAHDWMEDLGRLGQVTTFGVDGVGELYLTTWDGGSSGWTRSAEGDWWYVAILGFMVDTENDLEGS